MGAMGNKIKQTDQERYAKHWSTLTLHNVLAFRVKVSWNEAKPHTVTPNT